MNPTIFSRYLRGTLTWPCPMYHRSWCRDTVNNSYYRMTVGELEGVWEVEAVVAQLRQRPGTSIPGLLANTKDLTRVRCPWRRSNRKKYWPLWFPSVFFSTMQQLCLPMYFQMLPYSHPPLTIVSLPLATMYSVRCWISVFKLPDSRMSLCQNQWYFHSYIIL